MTTFDFRSLDPSRFDAVVRHNTEAFPGLNRSTQTLGRDGARWEGTATFQNLSDARRRNVIGSFVSLEGQKHRFLFRALSGQQGGALGGSPVVDGSNQEGYALGVRGGPISTSGWLLFGDRFTVNNELKMLTADVATDGAGSATLQFVPPLRYSPSDGGVVTIDQPFGRFMLASPDVGWPNNPGEYSTLAVDMIEDIR